MATSKRRPTVPLWRRLWQACKTDPTLSQVGSKDEFQLELAKEISRSNRRQQNREFALIHLTSDSGPKQFPVTAALVQSFAKRVRISDTIGWHSSKLAVLLPETDRIGAGLVANDLVKLAEKHGRKVDSSIYVYPWDDRLISVSNEIADAAGSYESDSDDDGGSYPGGGSYPDGGSLEQGGRVDSGHSPVVRNRKRSSDRAGQASVFDNNLTAREMSDSKGANTLSGSLGDGSPSVAVLDLIDQTESTATRTQEPAVLGKPSARAISVTIPNPDQRVRLAASAPTPGWKRAIDIAGAGLGLVVLSPVLIGAAVAIRLSSRGPVLFRQSREGKDGRPFDILKFRTMVVDAEAKQAELRDVSEQDGPAFKLKNDPRITTVGKFLRKSCIDELPQLVNILRGQMSLVGPRPLPVGESTACGPWQRMRLTVLPGLTCIWQARGGRNVSFDQWMRMDLEYIETRSFKNDVKLIFETAYIALMQRGSV